MKKRPLRSTGPAVGAAVRQLRKDRGWTLETLSARTDISVSGLSQLENGRTTRLRRETLTRLANAFGVAEEELDPQRWAARVASAARTLDQRRLVDAILSLSPEDAAKEAGRIVAKLAKQRKE
jgi:transcriptional regulator with XRE-family HTH domain